MNSLTYKPSKHLTRKTFSLIAVFALLLILNLTLFLKMSQKSKKITQIVNVLEEIDHPVATLDTQFHTSTAPVVLGAYTTETELGDGRAANLKAFFRKYNSDLYEYSDYIVDVSDRYQFDYRLIPAIAMQESTLCKFIPENSYNCWGYGIYGDTVTRFDSYEEAIDTVARGIKRDYLDHGLVTASDIMRKYTPASNGSWANGVNNVLRWLEE